MIYIILLLIGLIILAALNVIAMVLSPEGYEDENGFHYGKLEK